MKYYLVDVEAQNSVRKIRSNAIVECRFWEKVPIDKIFQNCIDMGYPTVSILSVTRVSKKTMIFLKNHISKDYSSLSIESSTRDLEKMLSEMGGGD